MTKKSHDCLVFVSRMQPLHDGHLKVIHTALQNSEHLIILVGSSFRSRDTRNPFTFDERVSMIRKSLTDFENSNTSILPLEDCLYNDGQWVTNVQHTVNEELRKIYPSQSYGEVMKIHNLKIGLIGHSKDHSSYYLKLFPTWDNIDVMAVEDGHHTMINATDIRNEYFKPQWHNLDWQKLIPANVKEFLLEWMKTEHYDFVVREHAFVEQYKKQWQNVPYPVIFSTTDCCVVQSGHVLVVERGAHPGKGKLALPGGFLNPNETILDGAIRELKEETKIKVPEAVLRGCIKAQKVFDDPNRSARGRTITHAFLFVLPLQIDLSKVTGADDAKYAFWLPLSELKAEDFFEDHFWMIQHFVRGL